MKIKNLLKVLGALAIVMVIGAAGGIITGVIQLAPDGYISWGDPAVNGSWRQLKVNDTVVLQLRTGGVWQTVPYGTNQGGGIQVETDPVFGASTAAGIDGADITNWNGKENAFSKSTAFNKNFGTAAGTVPQGNDPRINNGQTAFGWGNHADANYLGAGDSVSILVNDAGYLIDTVFVNHPAYNISQLWIDTWNAAEPGFAKNSGFNLSLGTGPGTVAEGDHSHSQLMSDGGLQVPLDSYIRIGTNVDGAWQIVVIGSDLVFQRKESGSWVTKQTYTP